MTTERAADDFATIGARLREVEAEAQQRLASVPGEPEPECSICDGAGWVMASYQPAPPNFDICPGCFNPKGHPCP